MKILFDDVFVSDLVLEWSDVFSLGLVVLIVWMTLSVGHPWLSPGRWPGACLSKVV